MNTMDLSNEAKIALNMLQANGFEAYTVGGCVRDKILGREVYDVDITTNATPNEIEGCFVGFRIIETGIKHGTVTVLVNSQPIEITTYRVESEYLDNRHPESVKFSRTLEDDLSRRDFTMNAMCCNEEDFVDLFGGMEDVQNHLIRAIGNPEERFSEDALRILRAIRFSANLGFDIEEGTAKAIHKLKNLILNLSAERIFSELKRILCGDYIDMVFLEYFDVFETFLPELSGMKGFDQHNFHHKFDIAGHTMTVVENAPKDVIVRLAALFHDCGKVDTFSLGEDGVGHFYSHASVSAEKCETALRRLKCDNSTREAVVTLVKIHDSPIEESEKAIAKKLNKYGEDILWKLIALQRADTLGLADEYRSRLAHFDALENILNSVLESKKCFSLKDLAINGNDLIAVGCKGKEIGRVLNGLLELVIEGKLENDRDILLENCKNVHL